MDTLFFSTSIFLRRRAQIAFVAGYAVLFTGCEPRHSNDDTAAAQAVTDAGANPQATLRRGPAVIVTGESVGTLPVVATRADLGRLAVVVRDTIEEGDEAISETVAVLIVEGDTVRAVLDHSDKVYVYYLRSPTFRTRDSLGVGTPLGQLLRFPGADAISGEGQVFVRVPQHCGLSFRLSDAGELGDNPDSLGPSSLRQLPEQTVVTEVLVFGCRRTGTATPVT